MNHAADSTHTTSQNKSTSRNNISKRKQSGATTTIDSKGKARGVDGDEDLSSIAKPGRHQRVEIDLREKRRASKNKHAGSSLAYAPNKHTLDIKPQLIKLSTIANYKS